MSQHTPGPWKVIGQIGYIYTDGDPYKHGQMLVGQVRGWGHLTGRGGGCAFDDDTAIAIQEANARLIAAAPDLLEACKSALGWYGLDGDGISDPTLAQLRAAIRKAEGQP